MGLKEIKNTAEECFGRKALYGALGQHTRRETRSSGPASARFDACCAKFRFDNFNIRFPLQPGAGSAGFSPNSSFNFTSRFHLFILEFLSGIFGRANSRNFCGLSFRCSQSHLPGVGSTIIAR